MEIQPKENTPPVAFHDNLRQPEIQFGRCCVTGEWGKVVAIDLGDIAIEAPVTDSGVEYDPNTKEVTFSKWRPAVFASQATFSEEGLEKLLAWSRDQESPIPMITPTLIYKWVVNYKDGSGLSQFQYNLADEEYEVGSRDIDMTAVKTVTLSPRNPGRDLPTYTFDLSTGKFFRNGQELDTDYDGTWLENGQLVYARKVTHTFGSSMGAQLARDLVSAHTTVLQLLGWHENGTAGVNESGGRCNIIAVDDRGNWRPWRQG